MVLFATNISRSPSSACCSKFSSPDPPCALLPSPLSAVRSAHSTVRAAAVFLRCATISQLQSLVRFAICAAFLCTRSDAFICPSLNSPQHAAPYYTVGRTSDVQSEPSVLPFPFLRTRIAKRSAFQCVLPAINTASPAKSLRKITPRYYNRSLPNYLVQYRII